MIRLFLISVIFFLFLPGEGLPADTINVYRRDSSDPDIIVTRGQNGKITQMVSTKIVLERGQNTFDIPVNEIESIYFDDEPLMMKPARLAVQTGNFAEAENALGAIDPTGITDPRVLQELEYFKAYISAQQGLIPGTPRDEIVRKAKPLVDFVRNHKDNWHSIQANEILGDLLLAAGSADAARKYYQPLIDAPWPEYRMRGLIARANIDLQTGKIADAKKGFEAVAAAKEPNLDTQKLTAKMGIVRCLAEDKDYDKAVASLNEVITAANPDDAPLCAAAYNLLGDFSRDAGKKNDAILAYLHVDLLYPKVRMEHIKALQQLTVLWKEKGNPQREQEARQKLKDRYGVIL
ncbi:hypothetical protein AGMMS50229_20540 [Campylobacterota bacterium]|nr:hypothetical protein AGMMS50229_20540 [Campylobacterota bacterium]